MTGCPACAGHDGRAYGEMKWPDETEALTQEDHFGSGVRTNTAPPSTFTA